MTSRKFLQKPLNFSQLESQLMNTIVALCTQRTPFENLDAFLQSLDAIRIRISVSEQHVLASSLWNVYTQMAEAQPAGVLSDIELMLSALSASLKCASSELAQNAIFAVASAVERIGFPANAISRRLTSLIINATNISEKVRLQTFARLNSVLSVSSMLHEHFDKFASKLVELLKNDMQIPMELVDLVVSLMGTSVSLLKIPMLTSLQKQVCLSALYKKADICVLKLLNALLEHNHEGVPLPIQVAVSVFQQGHFTYQNDSKFRDVLAHGRSICQLITRPRRVPNCASLSDISRTVSDDATTIENCSSSFDEWQKTQRTGKTTKINDSARTSNSNIQMDDNDEDFEEGEVEDAEEGEVEDEDEECVLEECVEKATNCTEDIITLDDDEEESAAGRGGNKIGANAMSGEKDFAFKTVDELLMDFTDE